MCASAAPLPAAETARTVAGAIRAAYDDGVRLHGDLDLTAERYSTLIEGVVSKCIGANASGEAKLRCISQLHTADLYVAKACGDRGEKAWSRFDALYRRYLNDLTAYLCAVRNVPQDLMESTTIDLFLPDRSGQSRICSYDGRSSLPTWLRVVVTNRVINEGQRKPNAARAGIVGDVPDGATIPRLESRIAARRYERLIADCLKSACDALTERERSILRWRFEDGLQLGDIADLVGVHQSTITRTVERIAKRLKQEMIARLRDRRLDGPAIEECISVLVESSGHAVSILDYIRDPGPAAAAPDPAPPV